MEEVSAEPRARSKLVKEEVGANVEYHGASAVTNTLPAVHGNPSDAPLPPMGPISPNLCTTASSSALRSNLSGQGPYSAGAGGMPPAPLGSGTIGLNGLGRTSSFDQGPFPALSVEDLPSNLPPSPGLQTTSSGGLLQRNSAVYTAGSGSLLRTASSGTAEALKTALHHTSSLRRTISRSSSANAREFVEAIARSTTADSLEAAVKADSFWRRVQQGLVARAVARALVCLFFLDNVMKSYQEWRFYQTPHMQQRTANYPHRYKDPGFPYFHLMVIMPCALLAMLGLWVPVAASLLVVHMLYENAAIILSGMMVTMKHWILPDELTVKHMAMLGSSALVLANSVRDRATSNTVAGLLTGNVRAGSARSLVLLLSRVTIAVLFITVGISQAKRIIARDWAWLTSDTYLRRDGHDNIWVLLEAVLAAPLGIGWRTSTIAPLLAITCLLEAFICWPPWESWPSVQYQSHVRSHFATNMGVAGGLLLLQTFGAGSFALDELVKKKMK